MVLRTVVRVGNCVAGRDLVLFLAEWAERVGLIFARISGRLVSLIGYLGRNDALLIDRLSAAGSHTGGHRDRARLGQWKPACQTIELVDAGRPAAGALLSIPSSH